MRGFFRLIAEEVVGRPICRVGPGDNVHRCDLSTSRTLERLPCRVLNDRETTEFSVDIWAGFGQCPADVPVLFVRENDPLPNRSLLTPVPNVLIVCELRCRKRSLKAGARRREGQESERLAFLSACRRNGLLIC